MLAATILLGKRKRKVVRLKRFLQDQSRLPASLVIPFGATDTNYAREAEEYRERMASVARSLVRDLEPGNKHHSIHCMTFSAHLPSLIGMNMDQFGRLFQSIRVPLQEAFPHCPETLEPGQRSKFSSRRLKLFMCLYRLKMATSFNEMQAIFGWSRSDIQESFDSILRILHQNLWSFHVGFLRTRVQWQMGQLYQWGQKHNDDGTLDDFRSKIIAQNAYQAAMGRESLIDLNAFKGSIGAVDGTYSLCPRSSFDIDTATGKNRMFSDYKHVHAYKLVAVVSHGLDGRGKYILSLGYGVGSASDKSVYMGMIDHLEASLVEGAALLGDHAFHACKHVIVPYTVGQVANGNNVALSEFNHCHSSDRMTSEHGMRYLKIWGILRGREDHRLFVDRVGDNCADRVFQTVWGLHNYIQADCPLL
mmetsp:Transcript_20924/g.35025  ORF Transcript_20924/g.35025 Transcript_20924/m.35025 type:complete len:419 (+) Transcript_20924:44-1300(+)